MAKNNIKSKKGFTIIEVVLVLAIAGLIFLMVFVALPALQRGQRDTQRRDDMARFLSQINQYQANNNGKVPSNYSTFIKNYLKAGGDTFEDPSTGSTYKIYGDTSNDGSNAGTVVTCDSSTCNGEDDVNSVGESTERGIIYVYTNATCEGENPKYIQGDRKIAIRIKLEGAGTYCGHN